MRRTATTFLLAGILVAGCAEADPSPTPAGAITPSTFASEPTPASAAGTTASAAASSGDAVEWERLADAPFARLEMAVAAHDGQIFLAGGLSPLGDALTDVEIFDPATGTWTEGPSLPTGIHHAALVSDEQRLLLIGGYLGSAFNRPSELVLELSPGSESWAEGPALPQARAAGAAAWDGSRIVYAGGVGADGVAADVDALENGTWSRLGSMVQTREHLAATSDGAGTVWLLGGRVGSLDTNLADVELVSGSAISSLGRLPTARGGVAAFHDPARGACLTGGEAPTFAITNVECIDADGAVVTLPELNEPHHGHGAAVLDGVAYVILGGPEPTLSAGSTIESLALGG